MWGNPDFKIRKFLIAESGIQLKDSGIPLTTGIRNPNSCTDKDWNPVPESKIHNMNPRLSWITLTWGKMWAEVKTDSRKNILSLKNRKSGSIGFSTARVKGDFKLYKPIRRACGLVTMLLSLRCETDSSSVKWISPRWMIAARMENSCETSYKTTAKLSCHVSDVFHWFLLWH